MHKPIKKIFKKYSNQNIFYKTNNNLKKRLQNPKDKIDEETKAGIYSIACNDCSKTYVGQTKRSIKTRYKEHFSHLTHNHPTKSAVASHCLETGHTITSSNLKLLKHVTSPRYLNAWESFYINSFKKEDLLNLEEGPIQNSILLKSTY